eukprot:CAMPEP_0113888598 /NCGR_PEP_ID=MMETSP0780_2-20120614/12956_1 /TAXON_ID=652834 /ORGANISM="Palpitomonas bilix" /LENGTH=214 /DNA_ID=CAMNT_0000877455 /DNA_START=282 /DNA_END=923 /DNA_ORIENTATION=- /assembly_acc=CAM_ASM_000599
MHTHTHTHANGDGGGGGGGGGDTSTNTTSLVSPLLHFSLARNYIDEGRLADALSLLGPLSNEVEKGQVQVDNVIKLSQILMTSAWIEAELSRNVTDVSRALARARTALSSSPLSRVNGGGEIVGEAAPLFLLARIARVAAMYEVDESKETCLARASLSATYSLEARDKLMQAHTLSDLTTYLNVLDCASWERLHDKQSLSHLFSNRGHIYPTSY